MVYRLFIFILLFSPLAFGTVEQWSLTIMESASFAAFLLLAAYLLRRKTALYEVPGLVPLLLLLLFIACQIVPLPAELVRYLAPATHKLYSETAGILEPAAWIPLSINAKATLTEFFRISSYVVFYILTVQLLTDKARLQKTVLIIIVFAALLSILAVVQKILSPDMIYWFRAVPVNATPMGPYVYHNAYAGLMEMLLPIALVLFYHYRPRFSYRRTFREVLAEIFNQHRTNLHILLGLAAILIFTSIFVSLSRGGIISLCLSTTFLLLIVKRRSERSEAGIMALFVFTVTVLAVGWFGWDSIFARFESIRNAQGEISNERLVYWRDSVNIFKDFFLTGTGFGTFEDIYPSYRTSTGNMVVDHAHNDYVELLSNGGVIGFFLVAWFGCTLFYQAIRAYLKRRESYTIYLFLGTMTGMVSILLHSSTDFNLQIGANGLYFFFLAGLAVSAANTRLRKGLGETRLPKTSYLAGLLGIPLVLIILGYCLYFNVGGITARNKFSAIEKINLNRDIPVAELQEMKEIAGQAAGLDPLAAKYHYAAANIEAFLGNTQSALVEYGKALKMNPTNSEYLQTTGLFLAGLHEGRAGHLLKAATEHNLHEPERYRKYAAWLLAVGERGPGIETMQKAISLEPYKTASYISLLVLAGLSDDEIYQAMPRMVPPYLHFADYLDNIGKEEFAAKLYQEAFALLPEEKAQPWYFYWLYRYYLGKKRDEAAQALMIKAVELLPEDVGIRLTLAASYEKMGVNYRAVEEYERALVLDPKNEKARNRLAEIKKLK